MLTEILADISQIGSATTRNPAPPPVPDELDQLPEQGVVRDQHRPALERRHYDHAVTTIVSFKGIAGQQRPYIDWLLAQCLARGAVADKVITEKALELLAGRLRTPLQIEQYLTRALEEGWRVGERPKADA